MENNVHTGHIKDAIVSGHAAEVAAGERFEFGKKWKRFREYHKTSRGMPLWRDVVDWVGGYPFEVARPEEVFRFFRDRGFQLRELVTCGGGHGCNQFVFEKVAAP